MNRTFKSLILSLAIASPASVFAATPDSGPPAAEHAEHHHRAFHFEKIERHAKELGIAPATLDLMKAAYQTARPDFQRLRQDLDQARQSGDEARITTARQALHDRRQALRAQIGSLLTDQQKAAMKQMFEQQRAEHAHKTRG
jgi:Spy/CpxP family protein refolding chaperone